MYAYAATEAQIVAQEFLSKINEAILFPLITLLMAIALLIFLYGAFEYVKGASNDGDRETGKRHLLWGTIGMLVMLSAMTILYLAAGTFGLEYELDDARESGRSWDGGFFGFDNDSYESFDNRAPSSFDLDDEFDPIISDEKLDGGTSDTGDNLFASEAKMQDQLLQFHQTGQYATPELKAITANDIQGTFYRVDGEYPDDYVYYENTVLAPACEDLGGSNVFSIEANNKMGRIFFCVY